jgi:hypothetical protein
MAIAVSLVPRGQSPYSTGMVKQKWLKMPVDRALYYRTQWLTSMPLRTAASHRNAAPVFHFIAVHPANHRQQ